MKDPDMLFFYYIRLKYIYIYITYNLKSYHQFKKNKHYLIWIILIVFSCPLSFEIISKSIFLSLKITNCLFVNIASNIVQIFHKRLSNQISYTFFLFFFLLLPPKIIRYSMLVIIKNDFHVRCDQYWNDNFQRAGRGYFEAPFDGKLFDAWND